LIPEMPALASVPVPKSIPTDPKELKDYLRQSVEAFVNNPGDTDSDHMTSHGNFPA
jgi:hypothetical protein